MSAPPHLKDAAKPRLESEIQQAILDYLKTVPGVVAWRSNTGAFSGEYKGKRRFVRFGIKGGADIIGFRREHVNPGWIPREYRARFLAIEVKRRGVEPTPAQRSFLDLVRTAGGLAIVATSVDDVRIALGR